MPTTRSYRDACGIARALDVVGERWALLVLRELFLGPQRFTDLRRALPKASSNMLSDRLRELEAHGVLRRRTLPPPAPATVYALTESGRELEPIVLALGAWGLRVPMPPAPVTLSPTSVLLFLRGSVRPDPQASPASYRVELDNTVWTVRTERGEVHVEAGEPAAPDATLRTDPTTLNTLIANPTALAAALRKKTVRVEGDEAAVRRLFASGSTPSREPARV